MPAISKHRKANKERAMGDGSAELSQALRPDWVTETPGECSYRLYMHDEGGESLQEIGDITREEYIALKLHLAKMRGYAVEEVA